MTNAGFNRVEVSLSFTLLVPGEDELAGEGLSLARDPNETYLEAVIRQIPSGIKAAIEQGAGDPDLIVDFDCDITEAPAPTTVEDRVVDLD